MNLADKITQLRKSRGLSQEDLAEQLNVSRQAVSRWEVGTTTPGANHILRLSQLFSVTTDYLLKDDCPEMESAAPASRKLSPIMAVLVCLEVITLLLQGISFLVLQNTVFGLLSFLPFAAILGGFEYAYRKWAIQTDELAIQYRRRFYRISVWLGSYFPLRFAITALMQLYPRPYSSLVLESIILAAYLAVTLSFPSGKKRDA